MKPDLVLVLLLILLVVLALILTACLAHRCAVAARRSATGGHDATGDRSRPLHFHETLHNYARSLTQKHSIGTHPLNRNGYEGLMKGGSKSPTKSWDEYETWEALQKDEDATAAYFKQRAAVLKNPNLDWGPVLADMGPKLKENREYIGIANLDADGRTLRLVASEASPIEIGDIISETSFAGVPSELVEKYASRPGLFLFHTHPSDPRGSPLPSSHDLSTAIHFGATSRFAACAVISRFGVLVHGLDWSSYKAINEAKDWKLALLNLCHDIVAAHETIRSWSEYTIDDYLDFYPRHRLLMFVYPSPEMVGDSHSYSFAWNLESPIDHALITEYSRDIAAHRSSTKGLRRNAVFSTDNSNSFPTPMGPLQFD